MEALTIEIIVAILLMVISSIGAILVYQFKEVAQSMKEITASVQSLNEKIAVVIKDLDWHMKEIDDIKAKLRER